jgi:hypothetical protein
VVTVTYEASQILNNEIISAATSNRAEVEALLLPSMAGAYDGYTEHPSKEVCRWYFHTKLKIIGMRWPDEKPPRFNSRWHISGLNRSTTHGPDEGRALSATWEFPSLMLPKIQH